jgi:hypothetical protein
VSTIEEILGRNSSDSGLESREYGSRGSAALTTTPLYAQKLPLTSLTSGGHSVGIVRSGTQAMDFLSLVLWEAIEYTHIFYSPILFAICTSTFNKCAKTYTVACRRVL